MQIGIVSRGVDAVFGFFVWLVVYWFVFACGLQAGGGRGLGGISGEWIHGAVDAVARATGSSLSPGSAAVVLSAGNANDGSALSVCVVVCGRVGVWACGRVFVVGLSLTAMGRTFVRQFRAVIGSSLLRWRYRAHLAQHCSHRWSR